MRTIDPVWASEDWDGNNAQSVTAFNALKKANNYVDLKTLMDDTSVYGADCGFTDPNGTPQPIPSDGKATYSRAIQHVGPCEIWLDDKMVFSDEDCYAKYGNENVDVKSVFPVDYSSCDGGGCKEMRFYWLAFQGVDGKTVWQSYKNCIPLEGSGGGTSQKSPSTPSSSSTGDTTQQTTQAPSSGDSPSSGNSDSPSNGKSGSPSSGNSDSPSSGDSNSPATQAPSTGDTPEVTPAPSTKCNGRKRRN
ncbi:hypothetical protein BBJ29_008609 [Phytophthora kernoviae]|uniref:Uncharacterized protein n=1 Tax=Phytophthora kernoviae TaxID=325452 RepID=A0A3F2RWI3_9STRA|nr:hypothetical protein BBJ29_008609 [Phytophthora kernoviae]RLN64761.1 hypothetical protein BBP00_00003260 [Phytophthora kernoviae]